MLFGQEPLAQAAEHLPFKQGVPGSIPGWLTIGPLVKRLRHRPFTAESWVQFPYGSPHTIAHEWLNKAVCELLFFARFWVWSLFGLYCDFFGLYAGRTVFSPPCVFFLSKDSASAIA